MSVGAWRIVKAKQAASAFSGDGARKFGGRWNRQGNAVIYTAGSASLAMLEMLVHLESQGILNRYVLIEVTLEESLIATIDHASLPKTWNQSPPPVETQDIGDQWLLARSSAVLRVPSVIVPNEFNYLINPHHKDFSRIKVGPRHAVKYDPRLIK